MLIQRPNRDDLQVSLPPIPIVAQFVGVELRPVQNEFERAARKLPVDDFKRV